MIKKLSFLRFSVALAFLLCTLFGYRLIQAKAYTDISNMSDNTFFGVWNGSIWTTASKLDYSIAGLSTVQTAVKSGNYTQAKADLLTYYKNRTAPNLLAYPTADSAMQLKGTLEADDFYFSSPIEYPIDVKTFTTTPSTQATTVTSQVGDSMEGGQVTFMLMARTHSSNALSINSKEAASNKPQLTVVTSSGTTNLNPSKDATIRGGSNSNTNYGSDTTLVVKEDTGQVVSDNTRRSYVTFDLSAITGTLTSASLSLYGSSNTGSFDVVVLNTGNQNYAENTIKWNNTDGFTYSWTGISGGTNWVAPDAYTDTQFSGYATRFVGPAAEVMPSYVTTGSSTYASSLIRQWLDFISDVGNSDLRGFTDLDMAIRVANMVPAYNQLRGSTPMDANANTAMLKFFWQEADKLSDPAVFNAHDDDNWGVAETKALYLVALYFPELKDSGASGANWMNTAKTRFTTMIDNLVKPDGSYAEASTNYALYMANAFTDVKNLLNLNSDSLGADQLDFDNRLQALITYIMDFSRPDGYVASFGDSDPGVNSMESVAYTAAAYPGRDDLLYYGTNGASGTVPGHTSSLYPTGKSAFMKTGYNPATDMFMSIDLNNGSHSHPDLNSVTAYAYGQSLLVDPGRYSYDNATPPNWLRKTTEAHNTLEIDNAAQAPGSATRTINYWVTNNAFDFYEGNANGAYSGYDHFRDILFLRGSYWIVSDYAKTSSTSSHSYTLNWHTLPNANLSINGTSGKTSTAFSSGGNLQIVPADPASYSSFGINTTDGYYSNRPGELSSANFAQYFKTTTSGTNASAAFDTVLFPTASGSNPDVQVTQLTISPSVAKTTATAIKIELNHGGSGDLGYYYLSHESTPTTARTFSTYNYNGKAAYVQTTSGGTLKEAALVSGTLLKDGATNLILAPSTSINDIDVKWSGTTVAIEGTRLVPDTSTSTAIAIYAPSTTSVTLNGVSASFTQSGNYIYVARAVNGYNPDDDAYIRGGVNTGLNYGTVNNLLVKRDSGNDNERRSLLRFNYSNYTGTITTAKLRLYTASVGADASRTIKIYKTTDAWNEYSVTYSNGPSKGTLLGSWTIANTDANKWFELDVSAYVSGEADKTASFYIVNEGTSTSSNTVEFYSKDSPIGKPILTIS